MRHREEIRTAKAGETIGKGARRNLSRLLRIPLSKVQTIVANRSDTQDGQWVCADCDEVFSNNMQAHGHAEIGHRLGWWCNGQIEEP